MPAKANMCFPLEASASLREKLTTFARTEGTKLAMTTEPLQEDARLRDEIRRLRAEIAALVDINAVIREDRDNMLEKVAEYKGVMAVYEARVSRIVSDYDTMRKIIEELQARVQ